MFGFFRKKETTVEVMAKIHAQTLDLFSSLGIVEVLAGMHKLALEGEASDEECNDLVMGAYRTLYLAAGLARDRVLRETKDSVAADQVANAIINSSGLTNIVRMIRESIPRTEFEPALALTKEMGMLFQAGTMLDSLVQQRQFDEAWEVWRVCAKGSYGELKKISIR